MTRPEAIKLGPFMGGLNLLTDPQNIDNAELVECINFEVDLDGSLMNRPAITETASNPTTTGTGRMKVIGRANFSAGGDYLITSSGEGTYAYNGDTWTFISAVISDCAVQYNDNVYIIGRQDTVTNGGRWDGTAYTADANMPKGKSGLFHKSRLYVVAGSATSTNPSRLTFSDTITSTTLTWNAANIIDVSPGDGDNLVDLIIYNDNLLLFKENSIYLLAYDISPASAVLRKIHGSIGVNAQFCVDFFDNSIFFLHEGNVWEMVNYEFKQVNQKVPFVLDQSYTMGASWILNLEPIWLRRVGDRLLVGFHRKRYSYHLLTRTWSEWKVNATWGQMFGPPMELINSVNTNAPVKFYMFTTLDSSDAFFYVTDKYVAGTRDFMILDDNFLESPRNVSIQCSIKTKNFDFDIPFVWKRLMWWGMHAYTGTVISANTDVNNVTQTNDLWENIGLFKWNELPGTWNNVLNNFEVTTSIQGSSIEGSKFFKFLKSLRFRTVSFRIAIENDGTTTGGPCRLFSLTATVGYKQVVAKDMN
jgi:hypothetical protein